jgi:hypothetical protein
MASYQNRRILPIILVVIIVIIAVAALVSLARAVFFSGDSQPAVTDISRQELVNTSVGHSVTMTVRGPIVADESFNSYGITVTPTERSLTTYRGYLDQVVDREALSNNTAAYEEFVYALDKARLADGRQLDAEKDDVRGVCATGRLYEFSIVNSGTTIKRLWTSTCNGSRGSLTGNVDQLRQLFTAQIPNADTLTRKIKL